MQLDNQLMKRKIMKIESTSETVSKPSWKNAILLTITTLALWALPAVALADDFLCPNPESTFWTGTVNNDWFNSGNWTNQVPICPGPVYSYYASINTSPTAQINTGGASACSVTLGNAASDSGTLSVDGSNGGNLTTCSNLYVGYQGTGKLSITNGGAVTTTTDASIASATTSTTSSNGSATVDGTHGNTNSTWTVDDELDIGGLTNAAGGTGLLTVTNGGKVTAANVHAWKSGTLTGNGTVSTTSGMTIDGTLEPNWTLTITGNLSFGTFGAMQCSVTPDNLGSIDADVSAGATLNGKVSVTMTGTFTPGTRFTLLHAAGTLGNTKFSSQSIKFPTGQGFTPTITYDADNVYLCLVPTGGSACN
jgi:T5SS/PEP-CTERM-associated repeat protein